MLFKELHEALNAGQSEKALKLLKNEQIRKIINSVIKCETTLYKAADKNNIEIVKELLKIPKIDVNAGIIGVFGSYTSPLHAACRNGNVEIVEVLLEAKASWFKCDDSGMNPLHHAAKTGSAEIVKMLLERRPHLINKRATQFKEHPTALHIASETGHAEVIKELKGFSADLHMRTKVSKLTACDLAVAFSQRNVLAYFKEIGIYHDDLPTDSDTCDGSSGTDQEQRLARLTNELLALQTNQTKMHQEIENIKNVLQRLTEGERQTQRELEVHEQRLQGVENCMKKLETVAVVHNTDSESDSSVDSMKSKQSKKNSIDKNKVKAEKMKKKVRSEFLYLTNEMNGDRYISHLFSQDILSLEFMEEVKDYPHCKKNQELLMRLLKMDASRWVFELKKAFKDDQKHLANIFNNLGSI